ncbi:hypothetical protein FVE85_1946 [Porphyridium purpureum]|uniref:Uncharacterized protein n=1 Tax=Porphyridium purpureum TaxID=35688 RepID=A0A5J4YW93_PORPP|nr:hypothetical protein FVE85_1946 [Porphyridium purpureum]|eukprot:POR4815..scf209_3
MFHPVPTVSPPSRRRTATLLRQPTSHARAPRARCCRLAGLYRFAEKSPTSTNPGQEDLSVRTEADATPTQSARDMIREMPESLVGNALLQTLCSEGRFDQAIDLTRALFAERADWQMSDAAIQALLDCALRQSAPADQDAVRKALALLSQRKTLRRFGCLRAIKCDEASSERGPGSDAESDTASLKFLSTLDTSRSLDLFSASGFLAVLGGGVSFELFEPYIHHGSHDYANALLVLAGGGMAVDRFVAQTGTFERVTQGLRRLFSDDPVRQCSVEAAHLMVAYLLGLPFVCFEPNVKELVASHSSRIQSEWAGLQRDPAEKGRPPASADELSRSLVDKYLVWMLSGVIAEHQLDKTLIETDPRCCDRLFWSLQRAKERGSFRRKARGRASGPIAALPAGSGMPDASDSAAGHELPSYSQSERVRRIQWAWEQATQILATYKPVHDALTYQLTQGSSFGECILRLEQT